MRANPRHSAKKGYMDTKVVKVTPSDTQISKGAAAMSAALPMYGFSAKEKRTVALMMYQAMVGNAPVKPAANSHAQLLAFVVECAAFIDARGSSHLDLRGNYGFFDEPDAVKGARELLATLGYSVCPACKGVGSFTEQDGKSLMCDTCDGKRVVL